MRQGRGRTKAKRYLCLFTCLVTRAVHPEMSFSLDTDSFINAFTRMMSKRGTPTYVISDNGSNFAGADRELRELVESFDQERIIRESTKHHRIDWKFNPPAAPHFGGVFEALIKSEKKAIKATLGDADINDEELHTAICGADSQPISYVGADPNDHSPLTPNHFLVGQFGGPFAPELLDAEEVYNPKKTMASCATASWPVLETLEKRVPSYTHCQKEVVPSETQFERSRRSANCKTKGQPRRVATRSRDGGVSRP